MATSSKNNCRLNLGDQAPGFDLPGVDGKNYSLGSFKDRQILVFVFTCNHCPYVQAWEDRLIAIQRDYESKGVGLIAINANETKNYPEDSFEKMVVRAREKKFNFPYLRDEDQSVARAYDAACTPEIFVFDSARQLRYHGRVDDNHQNPGQVKSHDLRNALDDLAGNRPIRIPETQAMGCSIKWSS